MRFSSFGSWFRSRLVLLFVLGSGSAAWAGAGACNDDDVIGSKQDDRLVGEIGAWERTPPVYDRTLHVRPPGQIYGAGDGSTWADAISGLPEPLERGTRYLLAAGEYYEPPAGDRYEHVVFETPLEGEKFVGVVKATEAEHGSDTGWEAALAAGPARLGPVSIGTGRLILDGQEGEGDAGHGIVISTRDCVRRGEEGIGSPVTYPWNTTAQYVALRHVEVADCGDKGDPMARSEDAIYNVAPIAHVVYRSCHVHDAFRGLIFVQGGFDVLVERCHLARAGRAQEAFGIELRGTRNVIIRQNVMLDALNVYLGLQTVRNVFFSSNVVATTLAGWDNWGAIYIPEPYMNVTLAGNTFYGLTGLNVGFHVGSPGDGLLVVNNLWAACRTNIITLVGEHHHNAFWDNWRVDGEEPVDLRSTIDEDEAQILEADPFVDATSLDLRLTTATQGGVTLGAPLDLDFSGNARGQDGTWDRGASEFLGD